VRRMVFARPATTQSASTTRDRDHRPPGSYPKPDSRYGVSKVFGEALGSLYATSTGMEVVCVRIGNVNPRPMDKRRLSIWLSPRDLASSSRSRSTAGIRFEIVYGVSGNRRSWYEQCERRAPGLRGADDSEPGPRKS